MAAFSLILGIIAYRFSTARHLLLERWCATDTAAAGRDQVIQPSADRSWVPLSLDQQRLLGHSRPGLAAGAGSKAFCALGSGNLDTRSLAAVVCPVERQDVLRIRLGVARAAAHQIVEHQTRLVADVMGRATDVQAALKLATKLRLSAAMRTQVGRITRAENASLFMIVLAAYFVLQHKLAGATDIGASWPMANRQMPDAQGLICSFGNTAFVRASVTPDDLVSIVIQRIPRKRAAVISRQGYPNGLSARLWGWATDVWGHFDCAADLRNNAGLPGICDRYLTTLRALLADTSAPISNV
jgi:hypothetical protein